MSASTARKSLDVSLSIRGMPTSSAYPRRSILVKRLGVLVMSPFSEGTGQVGMELSCNPVRLNASMLWLSTILNNPQNSQVERESPCFMPLSVCTVRGAKEALCWKSSSTLLAPCR
eukprot:3962830-Amphidinium_carterae.2